MGCRRLLPLLLLSLLSLGVGLGNAQLVGPSPRLSVTPDAVPLGPEATYTLQALVQNAGTREGQATISQSNVPAGWTITFPDGNQKLVPAGGSTTIPIQAETGTDGSVEDGTVTFSVEMSDLGQSVGPATDTVTLDYVPPVILPVPPPAKDYTPIIVSSILGGLAGLALLFWVIDSMTVTLHLEGERRPVTLGSSETYLTRVTNHSIWPRQVQLGVQGLPPGWYAAFAYPSVLLQPKEAMVVPINVRAPANGAAGPVDIRLRARPTPISLWLRSTRLDASAKEARSLAPPDRPQAAGGA